MPVRLGSVLRCAQSETSATREDVAHAPGVEVAQRIGPAGRIDEHPRLAQQGEAKRYRILAGAMGELVDEGLKHKAERVRARRAQRPGRHAELDHRLAVFEMRHELRREFVGVHRRRVGGPAVPLERHEMIAEGDQSARAVEFALEVEAGWSIEVVPDVVLAAPDKLDRVPRASSIRRPRP